MGAGASGGAQPGTTISIIRTLWGEGHSRRPGRPLGVRVLGDPLYPLLERFETLRDPSVAPLGLLRHGGRKIGLRLRTRNGLKFDILEGLQMRLHHVSLK